MLNPTYNVGMVGRRLLLLLVLLASAGSVSKADPPDDDLTPERIADIRRHVRNLDADSFEVREDASRQLWLIGPPTIPFLEEAAKQTSPEVRFRAQSLLKKISRDPIRHEIAAFCVQSDDLLDLETGMWLISRIRDSSLRKADLTKQYDAIAQQVRDKLGKEVDAATADPKTTVAALREVIFDDLKFNSNKEDYDNPDNCFPDRVLATHKGRPVFVAHVVVAVARRLGLPMVGLPVSGMYSVKYDGSRAPKGFPKEDIVLYPHDAGKILSREDRQKLFPSHDPDRLVPPSNARHALIRMLSNTASVLDHQKERQDELQLATEMRLLLEQHDTKRVER